MSSFYKSEQTNKIAFPLGGIGAGMLCMNGVGGFCDLSIEHHPNLDTHMGYTFAAIKDKTGVRLLEGPINPYMSVTPTFGFPRFSEGVFSSKFPFAYLSLKNSTSPFSAEIEAYSPFIVNDADNSSLPLASVSYKIKNNSSNNEDGVFSFNIQNPVLSLGYKRGNIKRLKDGVRFSGFDKGEMEAHFSVLCAHKTASVNASFFRGAFFDMPTMLWKELEKGNFREVPPHKEGVNPGASIFVSFNLKPLEEKTITVSFCWYVPKSTLRAGYPDVTEGGLALDEVLVGSNRDKKATGETHKPFYASMFSCIDEVEEYLRSKYDYLYNESKKFSKTFYSSSLPEEFIQAGGRNLSILKSPTVLRDDKGRFWGWEGSNKKKGSCHGSSTHVYNYSQAIIALFPYLEQTMREVEFDYCQDERGHQNFRAWLPISPNDHNWYACADGQLGGIIKTYRKWREDGDDSWLKKYWSKIKRSMEYCVEEWDKSREGTLRRPHHNTYDSEIWGADALGTGFYLGGLEAMRRMSKYLGEDSSWWENLRDKAKAWMEEKLFNGEYFQQLDGYKEEGEKPSSFPLNCSVEDSILFDKEGPKYQYGSGCLTDQLLGIWLSYMAGIDNLIDEEKEKTALKNIFKNNFFQSLENHVNPQRPSYAFSNEAALILCTWRNGKEPFIPFPYSKEAWSGVEYAFASYLLMKGYKDEALTIVKAVNKRYDGKYRNPFAEVEAGRFYARALSSYALITAYSNARYSAKEKTLYLKAPKGDFHHFFASSGSYGIVGVREGVPYFDVVSGNLEVEKIDYKIMD